MSGEVAWRMDISGAARQVMLVFIAPASEFHHVAPERVAGSRAPAPWSERILERDLNYPRKLGAKDHSEHGGSKGRFGLLEIRVVESIE